MSTPIHHTLKRQWSTFHRALLSYVCVCDCMFVWVERNFPYSRLAATLTAVCEIAEIIQRNDTGTGEKGSLWPFRCLWTNVMERSLFAVDTHTRVLSLAKHCRWIRHHNVPCLAAKRCHKEHKEQWDNGTVSKNSKHTPGQPLNTRKFAINIYYRVKLDSNK